MSVGTERAHWIVSSAEMFPDVRSPGFGPTCLRAFTSARGGPFVSLCVTSCATGLLKTDFVFHQVLFIVVPCP